MPIVPKRVKHHGVFEIHRDPLENVDNYTTSVFTCIYN
jgi:hypothetical protein